ncbi:MAG: PD40 domain-containing protein [Armatimonadetes bacterium]|nr:PD40 domain-containing protein [Armatimonadota bacterium]
MTGALLLALLAVPHQESPFAHWPNSKAWPSAPGERHLRNIRQLTFGGQNAEAYWSKDGNWITFQTRQSPWPDEQIIVMRADGSGKTLMSTGLGRCTCSYFTPNNQWLYFSSTHERNTGAQEAVDMSKGYVWRVNPDFALYRQRLGPSPNTKARMALMPVVKMNGYVAETTIAPNGKYMVFTGDWEGDIDIYRANLDGSGMTRLTDVAGYDGGPFISWDSKVIVYRRGPFDDDQDKQDYIDLHKQHLVRPKRMDLWIMDSMGRHKRQVTHLPGASFAPFMHPDGKRIIFASNYEDPKGREFDLYTVRKDGTGVERITTSPDFDGFPMFSRDGKKVVWASNRHGSVPHETNIFVADWVE